MRHDLRSTRGLLIGLAVFPATLFLAAGQRGHVDNSVALVQIDHPNSLGIAPDGRQPLYGNADHNTVLGYHHDLLFGLDLPTGHHVTVAWGGLDVDDALATAVLAGVLGLASALAIAVFADGQQSAAFAHYDHVHNLVLFPRA